MSSSHHPLTHLPSTREAAIVEKDVTLGEDTGLAILLVLLDGVTSFVGSDFELSAGVLGAVCVMVRKRDLEGVLPLGRGVGAAEGNLHQIHLHLTDKVESTSWTSIIIYCEQRKLVP